MEVNAVAYFDYDDGDLGWEKLNLIIKFRYGKRIFRERIVVTVASTMYVHFPEDHPYPETYKTRDEYYDYVNSVLDDKDWLRDEVEFQVKEWFTENNTLLQKEDKRKAITKKISNIDKMEVKVKIE